MSISDHINYYSRILCEARKIREADISDGTRVNYGSDKHISDLSSRISELEYWRNKYRKGTEARANYSRIINRLKAELRSAQSVKSIGTIEESNMNFDKLNEGGAAGHLMHLYDNPELTFGEIKDVLKSASEGKLEKVSEKLDGMNLVFSYDVDADQLKTARNAGDIKNGGMDAEAIASKFKDRGNISDAFNTAFKVLSDALSTVPNREKEIIFGSNASIWYSMEVVYAENPNVINYDSNAIVFHGWPVFELKNGTINRKDDATGVEILQTYIDKMQNAISVRNWQVKGPALLRLKKLSDGSILQKTLSVIDSTQASAGVGDQDTIEDYLKSLLKDEALKLNVNQNVLNMIVSRCLESEGSSSLVAIKKVVSKEKYDEVRSFVKESSNLIKTYIQPIEDAIHKFAVEILRGLSSTLISDTSAEVERLRNSVTSAVKAIESSGSESAMEVLHRQMQKLGSLESIASPMEGVVFIYKGNAYKFTGAFAPANQILGLFKYGRNNVKITTTENKANSNLVMNETVLKKYIKNLISEQIILEKGKGTSWDDEESAALEKLQAAEEKYDAWLKTMNAIENWKIKGNKSNKPTWPQGMSSKSGDSLLKAVKKAEEEYSQYNPEFASKYDSDVSAYKYQKKTKQAPVEDGKSIEGEDNVILSIDSISPLKWYKWPEEVISSGKSYSGASKSSGPDGGDDKGGTGPGEIWLGYMLGANVMGGGVSYDLVTSDGRKWEVKEIQSQSETIRPGTEGIKIYQSSKTRLDNILNQIKEFVSICTKEDFFDANELSEVDNKIINYVSNFLDEEYDLIVNKNEISISRFKELRRVLKALKSFKQFHGVNKGDNIDTSITIMDKTKKLDKSTFIDIAKMIEKSTGESDVLSEFEKFEIAINVLKDPAFDNEALFFDEWFDSVNVEIVFEKVNGMFIVNQRGFIMIPKENLKDALEFSRVTQGKPRFSIKFPIGP